MTLGPETSCGMVTQEFREGKYQLARGPAGGDAGTSTDSLK